MSKNATLSFGLSEVDVSAIAASNAGKVTVSNRTVAKTRSGQFVPWNCPFDECAAAVGVNAPRSE